MVPGMQYGVHKAGVLLYNQPCILNYMYDVVFIYIDRLCLVLTPVCPVTVTVTVPHRYLSQSVVMMELLTSQRVVQAVQGMLWIQM